MGISKAGSALLVAQGIFRVFKREFKSLFGYLEAIIFEKYMQQYPKLLILKKIEDQELIENQIDDPIDEVIEDQELIENQIDDPIDGVIEDKKD